MQLRYEQLPAHLNKSLAPLYVVSGDVPLLTQEANELIRHAAKQHGYHEKLVFHVETGFSWAKFQSEINNFSLFANKQLIELHFAPTQLGDAGSKALQAYAAHLPADKILLLSTTKLDAGQQKSSWMQAVSKVGHFIQIWPITVEQLPQWLEKRLQLAGLQTDRAGLELLASHAEGNLLAAAQEIEKLRLLHIAPTTTTANKFFISADAIAEAISNNARFDIFQLVDAALQADRKRVLAILTGLRQEGIEATLVLWALARELRTLAAIAHAITLGLSAEQALQKHAVWEKRKPLFRRALQQHSAAKFRQLLQHASRIDLIIKGLSAGRCWDELEQLALALAGINLFYAKH